MNGLIERVRADIDGHGGAILKERIIQGGRGNGSKEFDFTYLCQATHGSIVCRSIDDNNRVIRILMVITESPAVL